jgi:hypothetical protein
MGLGVLWLRKQLQQEESKLKGSKAIKKSQYKLGNECDNLAERKPAE